MEKEGGITISVVSPVYRGEKMLDTLVGRNTTVLQQMIADGLITDYEIILVNDASPDNSWAKLKEICAKDSHVKGINLSRNFGQHYAITAGLSKVSGDWIVVMDCDLQDRPEEIPGLFTKAGEGYDVVFARRQNKQFGFFKKFSSTAYHATYDWLSGTKTDPSIGNFGIYARPVIDQLNKMPEKVRNFVTQVSFLGFRQTTHDVAHDERLEGTSSYSLAKLLKLAFDSIISNTNKPLHLAVRCGMLMTVISFCLALYNLIAKLSGLIAVPGFTSIIFSIWFVGGLILFIMGILGLYIDKIFNQVKDRPLYVIMEELNFE